MQSLGLNAAERRAFHDALRSPHSRIVKVELTDLDGDTISTLNNRVLDGQVTVDYDAEVTRVLSLSLLDPDHSLNFDSDSPDDGSIFADRMVRVVISYRVSALPERVNVPVFLGPVTKLNRSGDTVEIEAQGKESLAMGAVWHPTTLKKGMTKTDAIRFLLRTRAGETRFSIPDLGAKLPKARSLNRNDAVWNVARGLAKDLDRQLFYDGAGTAVLRHLPQKPVWTFRPGTGGDVVSDVQVSYSLETVKNVVVVNGKVNAGSKGKKKDDPNAEGGKKGGDRRVRGQAVADKNHPLSPRRLGRWIGKGDERELIERRLVETVDAGNVSSQKAAQEKAERILRDRLRSTVEVSFDALPIPHLEPGDLVAVDYGSGAVEFRLKQFTIPLGVSGSPTMSVGYLKKVTANRRRIRR